MKYLIEVPEETLWELKVYAAKHPVFNESTEEFLSRMLYILKELFCIEQMYKTIEYFNNFDNIEP